MSNNSQKGIFISFEGIDGSGKSTHIDALAQALSDQGFKVLVTREPGGTALAEKLRTLLLQDAMDPLTESLLVFAARRDHIEQVIRPALAQGNVVLCDRFTDATFAYQGAGRDFDLSVLSQLEAWVQCGLQPDITYWFDLEPAIAAARLANSRLPDRFEAQPVAFFQAVRAGYAKRAKADPQRFVTIDANQTREAVFTDLLRHARLRGHLV